MFAKLIYHTWVGSIHTYAVMHMTELQKFGKPHTN